MNSDVSLSGRRPASGLGLRRPPSRIAATGALLALLALICLLLAGCGNRTFVILSGSENKTLEPILTEFGKENGYQIQMSYLGSIDIMTKLGEAQPSFDAVWPASSLWINLGDKNRVVKYTQSIMTSPVVFGIRKSLAEKLGFVGKDVTVARILEAIRAGTLKFMMTSATQSNSGASAYLGFLYALSGNPEVLTSADLRKPKLKQEIRDLLGGINRSSGSSGWLKDLFLQGGYDAMVNYESLVIEANQTLTARGEEPLYVVYPVDGLVIADSPLGYVNKGDKKQEEFFLKLQQYLLSPGVQQRILALGRRTGLGGVVSGADPAIFNPDWGIDANRILSPITLPSADVILEALTEYQTGFRKPSFTVYCLDYSGSMAGAGEQQVEQAMSMLLDPREAGRYLLQTGPEDVTVVIPFSGAPFGTMRVDGNDPAKLAELLSSIRATSPDGNTDIYSPVIAGLQQIAAVDPAKYITAVVLMTDGMSNTGSVYADLASEWNRLGLDVPVFSILFGEAEATQLDPIAALSKARVFDGRTDLVQTFRDVKGYNN